MIKNNRILIVDDNEAIHHDIRSVLGDSKISEDGEALELESELFGTSDSDEVAAKVDSIEYVMNDAYQGQEAIEMVEAAQQENYPYSLIFMDVRMPPGIDGVQTIQKIWEMYPNIEMVICTAYSDYSLDKIILSLGKTEKLLFMKKPFDATALKQITLTATTKWQLHQKSIHYVEDLEQEVAERTKQLNDLVEELRESKENAELSAAALLRSHNEMEQLLKSITAVLIGVSCDDLVTHWNKAAEKAFDTKSAQVMGKPFTQCGIKWDWDEVLASIAECRDKDEQSYLDDILYTRSDGKEGFLHIIVNPMASDKTEHAGYLMLASDTTERKALESRLAQAQKLESIGQLAAGIAHEINTPIQYVGDNTRFLEDAFGNLNGILSKNKKLVEAAQEGTFFKQALDDVKSAIEEVDLDYWVGEIPIAIQDSLDGIDRVANIVRAMKAFSHPGTEEKTGIDINAAIENTITVARNEWKYVADMVKELDTTLPLVPCFPADLNQVILNIIINAAHAIGDVIQGTQDKGKITVGTRMLNQSVEIRISDTGTGIPDELRQKVFDPFFTTKAVGKGTGQGLAISHNVVVEKHGGSISIDTEMGKGTTFIISIPLS